jgi:hypothetical protein
MDAKELAKKTVAYLNNNELVVLSDIIAQAKEAETEAAERILKEAGIPEEQAELLLEEMDGLILFVPEYYQLASEVKR